MYYEQVDSEQDTESFEKNENPGSDDENAKSVNSKNENSKDENPKGDDLEVIATESSDANDVVTEIISSEKLGEEENC